MIVESFKLNWPENMGSRREKLALYKFMKVMGMLDLG